MTPERLDDLERRGDSLLDEERFRKETCDHEEVEMVGTSPSNLRFFCEVCGVEMMGDGPDAEGRETYCEAPRFD